MRDILRAVYLLPIIVSTLATPNASALDFPPASPKATLRQTVGLDDVTINYSRPRARGREIWGDLVPWGEVWRTGADYPTTITFTAPVLIQNQPLNAGTYALYSIPQPEHWTIIFSRNSELWGAFGYKEKEDALRIVVKPNSVPFREAFEIDLKPTGQASADLVLNWAGLEIPIPIAFDISERIKGNVYSAISKEEVQDWGVLWKGARFLLEEGHELLLAQDWIRSSIEIEENWMNLWTAAELHAARGAFEEAEKVGRRALEVCLEAQPYCAYGGTYGTQIQIWSKKLRSKAENSEIDR